MNEKTSESARKFIAAITDPLVGDFVDLRKLTKSEKYLQAVNMAVEHANEHSDLGYLTKILSLLGRGAHATSFLDALRGRVAFVVADDGGALTLKKSSPESSAKKTVLVRKVLVKMPKPVRSVVVKKSASPSKNRMSEDLMNSRLMLSGSYGSGKRR